MSSEGRESNARELAADSFQKGTAAMLARDWDFAIEMFNRAMQFLPDSLICRQAKIGCIRAKTEVEGGEGPPAG